MGYVTTLEPNPDICTGRHVASNLHAHLVFVTKSRRGIFDDDMLKRCEEMHASLCAPTSKPNWEFNGKTEHMHLLVHYPPKITLSELINSLKCVSSRRLRAEYTDALPHSLDQGSVRRRIPGILAFRVSCCWPLAAGEYDPPMAKKVVTLYTDDLTSNQSDAISTHVFSLNGVEYEIDLAPENYEKLNLALRPFIDKGRKTGRRKKAGRSSKAPVVGASAEEVRAWARTNGYDINDRGRVPREIREAFEAAQ
ncbi:IS200/IS605 family transposase [Streptomyces sp. NPDC093982]|uniref:IS200/IS605 family transposase n=1 Tax=Streptomyces sp. NPDC093982 TaxID=3155077 RepID=UPI003422B23A